MSEREELTRLIATTFDCGYVHEPCEQDYELADVLISAGYKKARIVTTIGDLTSLQEGTAIRTAHGQTMQREQWHWIRPDSRARFTPLIAWLPVTVLWEPAAGHE